MAVVVKTQTQGHVHKAWPSSGFVNVHIMGWKGGLSKNPPEQERDDSPFAASPVNPPERWEMEDMHAEGLTQNSLRDDVHLLVGIIIVLVYPWVFFAVIWLQNGVPMGNHIAKVVMDNPRGTTYFVTLIGSIISIIVSSLFSLAITRFGQELVTNHSPVQVFHVTILSAIRNQSWPWSPNMKSLRHLLNRRRWWPATLLIFCIAIFASVTSSATSLITPIPFNQTAILTGSELDFASSAPDCLNWFEENTSNNCEQWRSFRGLKYATCLGEGQRVNILESGRGKILELLLNKPQSLIFSELVTEDGLHFVGSTRGALPTGPNDVHALETLQNTPFSIPEIRATMISHNYTLEHQGLNIDISCAYDTESPIVYQRLDLNSTLVLQYNSSCDGLAQVLTNVLMIPAPNSNNSLLFWACQSPPDTVQAPSYFIYLRGVHNYETVIGNITCTLSPSQPAVFPVTYESIPGIFSSKGPIETSGSTNPLLIEQALLGLASFMANGQNWYGHQIAELVITFGVHSFGLESAPSLEYLPLYEALIQGILDYEATYLRLMYSAAPNAPPSCFRTVNGSLSYQVIGWSMQAQNIGYLLPMTVINLASLGILIWAMRVAKRSGTKFNPTDLREILYFANIHNNPAEPNEWIDRVTFSDAKVPKADF